MPVSFCDVTSSTAPVATAASMALPPCRRISRPACAASGSLVATMPCRASTSERPCADHPWPREPGTAGMPAAGVGLSADGMPKGLGRLRVARGAQDHRGEDEREQGESSGGHGAILDDFRPWSARKARATPVERPGPARQGATRQARSISSWPTSVLPLISNRATVTGRRKRRGPALPGFRYSTGPRYSAAGLCEWP